MAYANSADQEEAVWSESALFAIQFSVLTLVLLNKLRNHTHF